MQIKGYFTLIFRLKIIFPEALTRRCSIKKLFLKLLQNSQGNTCAAVSSLVKIQI